MSDPIIHCPQCGAAIPISQALQEQVRQELENRLSQEWQQRLQQSVAAAESRARDQATQELQNLRNLLSLQQQKT